MSKATSTLTRTSASAGHETAIADHGAKSPNAETKGNQAQTLEWLAFLAGHGVHPKLSVSAPGDADERAADAMADRVMAMAVPAGGPLPIAGTGASALSRACCEECSSDDEEEHRLSRRAAGTAPVAASAARAAAAAVGRGGAPLEASERAFFEPRFGHDLSAVRIHTGSTAARAAMGIGALAYSHGQDIAFAPGQYRPGTPTGRRLIAHELAHTLQHSGGAPLLDGVSPPAGGVTIMRRPVDRIYRQCPPAEMRRGGAAGCGICMGGNFGVIGALVHQLIQYAFFFSDSSLIPSGPGMELVVPTVPEGDTPPFNPEVDLSRITEWHGLSVIEIAEIKPFDDAGTQAQIGRNKLDDYSRELRAGGMFDEVRLLRAPPPAPFPLVEPTRPPGCPPQMIHVCQIEDGLYQYHCSPSWAEAQRNPACRCGRRRERERERERVRVPRDVPVTPPVSVPDAPGVPQGRRPPVYGPDLPPVTAPEDPISVPDGPVIVPEGPVSVPEGPVTAPDGPEVTPDGPVTTPDGPIVLPGPWGEPANDNVEVEDEGLQEAARVALAATAAAVALWAIRQLARQAGRRVLAPLEAAAVAALVIFYSENAHAEVGPGESPLETLFDAMEQDGIPIDDEMRARIEADPALKQALENAAQSGDLTEAQRAIAQRTMEIIAANPDEFSDEDLRILAEGMETATGSSPATQPTVESLRRAIEARRRGEPIGPIIDQGLADASAGVSRAPDAEPHTEADAGSGETEAASAPETPVEPLPIPEEYREQLAASPERERLFRAMVGHQDGLPLTNEIIERFLATVPADLSAEETDALIERVTTAEGATEDEIFEHIERAIREVRGNAEGEPGDPEATGEVIDFEAEEIVGGSAPETGTEPPVAPQGEEPAPAPEPAAPTTANPAPSRPRGGLTPDQLARLQRFLASGPTPLMVRPLPPAESRVPGHRFTRLVAVQDGSNLVAGFVTLQITTVRSANDFDVIFFPTTFYRANGRARGRYPSQPATTTITGVE